MTTLLKIIAIGLTLGVLVGLSVSCTTIRTDVVKPALTEEIAWSRMFQQWSEKVYVSRDFRAGFLLAATKPFSGQLPGSLNLVIQDIGKQGNPEAEDYKSGSFGGSYLAMYCITAGEGTRWLFNQLSNLGVLPVNILAGVL